MTNQGETATHNTITTSTRQNLPIDCVRMTGVGEEDSSCFASGELFSEGLSGVDSFGFMIVSETSPEEAIF